MRISDENVAIIIFLTVLTISLIIFALPFALIILLIFGVYKGIVWYNRKKRLPEINKRYVLLNELRNECEKYVELIRESGNKEYIKDYQYLYNYVMYNDEEWVSFIEKKTEKISANIMKVLQMQLNISQKELMNL